MTRDPTPAQTTPPAEETGGPLTLQLTLQVEPCPEDAGRYRWTLRAGLHPVRTAPYALPDAEAAWVQGRAALAEAAALQRDTTPAAPH